MNRLIREEVYHIHYSSNHSKTWLFSLQRKYFSNFHSLQFKDYRQNNLQNNLNKDTLFQKKRSNNRQWKQDSRDLNHDFNVHHRKNRDGEIIHNHLKIKKLNNKVVVERVNQNVPKSKKEIKTIFLNWCNDLAAQGSWSKLISFIDLDDFTFREFQMGNIIDTATDEMFLASIILALVNANQIERAESFFLDKFQTKLSPDGIVIPKTMFPYCNLIKGFAKKGDLQKLEQYTEALKDDLPDLMSDFQSLIIGFKIMALLKKDRLDDALQVFRDEASKYDPEAISQEKESHNPLKAKTITPLINALAKRLRIQDVEEVYNIAVLFGSKSSTDLILHNSLLDAYARVGDESNLLRVFSTYFVFPDTPLHLSIVDRFTNPKLYIEASRNGPKKIGLHPNEYTCTNFLRLWASRGDFETLKRYLEIFSLYLPENNKINKSYSMLVLAYSNNSDTNSAREIFLKTFRTKLGGTGNLKPIESDYANLIRGYAKVGDESSIHEILKVMKDENLLGRLTINTILRGYSESNSIDAMRNLFHEYCLPQSNYYIQPDTFTFNTIMQSFARLGLPEKVDQLINTMKSYQISPNIDTLLAILLSQFHESKDEINTINDLKKIFYERISIEEHENVLQYLSFYLAKLGSIDRIQLLEKAFISNDKQNSELSVNISNAKLLALVKRGNAWKDIFDYFLSHFNNSLNEKSSNYNTPNDITYQILIRRLKHEPQTPEIEKTKLFLEQFKQIDSKHSFETLYDEFVEEL